MSVFSIIISRNLLHLPTSVNSHQDTVSHILVVHQWQVCLMHNLIRVWFSNSFLLSSGQCEAYSQHWYKHQCCFVRDYILQILFSSYLILSPCRSINYLLQKSEAFQSVHHVTFILCYTVLYNFFGLRCRFGRHRADVHRTSCALVFSLIRVRKHWWDDITQGKQ